MTRPDDTSLGGADRQFPPTEMFWSVIRQARDRNSPHYARAINELCQLYWKPAYAYIRAARSLGNEQAKDATQEFFAELIEGELLSRYAPERGSFRAYLRGALHLFLIEAHRKSTAQKRGGGRALLSLDNEALPPLDEAAGAEGPEAAFERQWERSLLDQALGDLRQELARAGREPQYRIFERYELGSGPGEPATYAALAAEFGVKATDVDNWLRECRRRLRELAVQRIRSYVADEEDVAQELAAVFGGT
jgi:RNA polymerase sigma-70 factor (ECF subfamily)